MKYIIFFTFLFISCVQDNSQKVGLYKKEVLDAELAFAKMAREEGVEKAFLHFAAPEAVLFRDEKVLKGQDTFKSYFAKPLWKKVSLDWKPAFVDVAASGDLAYTWGPYQFSISDSSGAVRQSNGIFHTVWKRQADGDWKFVWD